jgi:Coenzyme PQQ synthesis protein D (PqqD)
MSAPVSLPAKHVVFTDFDGGEGILVDLNTRKYYQLNETAMLVWKCLEQGKSLDETVSEVTTQYEVTTAHARESVRKLLDDLQSYKLVVLK